MDILLEITEAFPERCMEKFMGKIGTDYVFHILWEEPREEAGQRAFHFRECNELPTHEYMGQCLVDIPSKVWHIEMDGNCLFRALSYMLVGEEEKYNKNMSAIVQFFRVRQPPNDAVHTAQ